jgi:hypothetical protein
VELGRGSRAGAAGATSTGAPCVSTGVACVSTGVACVSTDAAGVSTGAAACASRVGPATGPDCGGSEATGAEIAGAGVTGAGAVAIDIRCRAPLPPREARTPTETETPATTTATASARAKPRRAASRPTTRRAPARVCADAFRAATNAAFDPRAAAPSATFDPRDAVEAIAAARPLNDASPGRTRRPVWSSQRASDARAVDAAFSARRAPVGISRRKDATSAGRGASIGTRSSKRIGSGAGCATSGGAHAKKSFSRSLKGVSPDRSGDGAVTDKSVGSATKKLVSAGARFPLRKFFAWAGAVARRPTFAAEPGLPRREMADRRDAIGPDTEPRVARTSFPAGSRLSPPPAARDGDRGRRCSPRLLVSGRVG